MLFAGVTIEEGAVVEDSVIMPGCTIKAGAVIRRAIVAEMTEIGEKCVIGEKEGGIALVGQNSSIPAGYIVKAGEQVDNDSVKEAR